MDRKPCTPAALKAARIVHALLDSQGGEFTAVEETVTDALTDLRHLCDMHNLDFGKCDRLAYAHYLKEKI